MEFDKLTQLETLALSHNSRIGSIPSELGHLPVLSKLLVKSNSFTDCIPRNPMDISINDFQAPSIGFCAPPAEEDDGDGGS